MSKDELKTVYGGVNFTATLLSAIVKGITSIYDIGRRIGSALIRYKSGNVCTGN